ncbi:Crp/Fnr family transcriptional regulator [Candidatus Daviesbacteria bacterium]|nr:Crp/Fnr family transcriptional regulator [Candidatus Daviesbacteria bacterium]
MEKSVFKKLENFFSKRKLLNYKKGEIIIRSDDIPQGVFYVQKGYVSLYTMLEDGRQITLNIFKPGSYFSMMWAISDIPNAYCFQAITQTSLYRAPKGEVVDFLKRNPDVLFDVTRRILVGLDGILTIIQHLVSGTAYQKIGTTLVILAKRFGRKSRNLGITIELALTHQDIANLCGITRETTSLAMKKLEKKKLISYNTHHVVVKSVLKLEKNLKRKNLFHTTLITL